jgi:hypothetical protein
MAMMRLTFSNWGCWRSRLLSSCGTVLHANADHARAAAVRHP